MYNKKIPIDTSCGFRIAIEVMGGKWKPYIIYELLDDPRRPSELQRRIPEASERVLAQQLRQWGNAFRPRLEEILARQRANIREP